MRIPAVTLLVSAAVGSGALALTAPSILFAATTGASTQPVIGLQFQTGGRTAAGRKQMAQAAKDDDYDLQIHMPGAAHGGSWRKVDVVVTNARHDTVLESHAGGPLFYARLPKGVYTVMVKSGGRKAVIKNTAVTPNEPVSVTATLG